MRLQLAAGAMLLLLQQGFAARLVAVIGQSAAAAGLRCARLCSMLYITAVL